MFQSHIVIVKFLFNYTIVKQFSSKSSFPYDDVFMLANDRDKPAL